MYGVGCKAATTPQSALPTVPLAQGSLWTVTPRNGEAAHEWGGRRGGLPRAHKRLAVRGLITPRNKGRQLYGARGENYSAHKKGGGEKGVR